MSDQTTKTVIRNASGQSLSTVGLERDNCEICQGEKGGVKGNENIIDGKRVCDYCHAAMRANITLTSGAHDAPETE